MGVTHIYVCQFSYCADAVYYDNAPYCHQPNVHRLMINSIMIDNAIIRDTMSVIIIYSTSIAFYTATLDQVLCSDCLYVTAEVSTLTP